MAQVSLFERTLRGTDRKYCVFVPRGYEKQAEHAAILFLHGAGETGANGVAPTTVGIGPAIRARDRAFPFLTVFPQSRYGSWRHGTADAEAAMEVLEEAQREWRIDARRVHLTGISMGGYGTWSLAAAYPDRWASIAPVCGGGNPSDAGRIRDIPCWAFHGREDAIIPVEASRSMIEALRQAGAEPRYTEYPGVGHNSWDLAYDTAELYDWMCAHSRGCEE